MNHTADIEFFDVPDEDVETLAEAVDFFLNELGVTEFVRLAIEYDNELGLDACCDAPNGTYSEDHETIDIFLNPDSQDDMMRNLAHELVHVKQYVKGDLVRSAGKVEYCGRLYEHSSSYSYEEYKDLPWEVEAFELEETLWESYCDIYNGPKH